MYMQVDEIAHLCNLGRDLLQGIFEETIEPAVFLLTGDSCQIGTFPDPSGFGCYDAPSAVDKIVQGRLIA